MKLAQQTVRESQIEVPVLVDEIDNPVWCTYGQAPNSSYLISRNGEIIVKQPWYDPETMAQAINKYLVEKQE